MWHHWRTNSARASHPKLFTLSPTSQRPDPCRNRDVSFLTKMLSLFLCLSTRCVCDMFALAVDGKLEERRPSLFPKLFSSGSVPELGHSSSSEGEKEFASPEWDVPLSKNSVRKSRPETQFFSRSGLFLILTDHRCPLAEADSLQQISLQTINADAFLKRAATTGTLSPPPTSPSSLSRGTYSSVLNSNRYPLDQNDFDDFFSPT